MVDYEMFKKTASTKGTKTYISFDGTLEADAEVYNQIQALKGEYDIKAVVKASIGKLFEATHKK